jgi:hypothetical protein
LSHPGANKIVHATGLFPKAKLAAGDVASDALGGGSDQSKLVIVDGTSTIHGQMRDEATIHEIDEYPLCARTENMSTHEPDTRSTALAGFAQALGDGGQEQRGGCRDGFVQGPNHRSIQVVNPLAQRLDPKSRSIKKRVRH